VLDDPQRWPMPPAAMRSGYARCAGFEVHFTEWGEQDAPALFMWHGLARTGRDFDPIAAALARRFRVICPDQIGRGLSQWSAAPERDYCLSSYTRIALDLADAIGVKRCCWLGTSMGGAIGIAAGATTLKGRIDRMVINDIGPTLPEAAVNRIRSYVGAPPAFATMSAYETWVRQVYAPFGAHADAQWRHLAETTARRLLNGQITPHYDPAIVRQFELHPEDYVLWSFYDALNMPTLVLRGAESDLLLPDVAQEMTRRGPRARIVDIPGCGHAPGLNTPEQIRLVGDFLEKPHA
jgi:pimeloyl-ACP methyl ester carboxylesterase